MKRIPAKHNPFRASDWVDMVSFGTITGAGTGTMTIPMTFKDAGGTNSVLPSALGKCVGVLAWMTDDAAGQTPTTVDPSAISAAALKGSVQAIGANNKQFRLGSNASGEMTLVIAMTTGASHYLNILLPDGRVIVSAELAF